MNSFLKRKSEKFADKAYRTSSILMKCSTVVVVMLITVFVVALAKFSETKSVDNRVSKELETVAGLQATALRTHMMEQYEPLQTISRMMANGEEFAGEAMRPTLKAIVETRELSTLSFADLDGNVSIW